MAIRLEAVRLFGSTARGDADDLSDLDILIVVSRLSERTFRRAQRFGVHIFGATTAVSVYSAERLRELYSSGALFAWHLFLESKNLAPERGTDLIEQLGQPADTPDLHGYLNELFDLSKSIIRELEGQPGSLVYEAGILYLASRNAGIAACWKHRILPVFSRYAPFQAGEYLSIPFPLSKGNFDTYYLARRASNTGAMPPKIESDTLYKDAKSITKWISLISEKIHAQ